MAHPKKKKPGPEPETLSAEGVDWKDALKHAMRKKKPAEGWPGQPKKRDRDQPRGGDPNGPGGS